jgi:hypothetical protein
MYKHETGFWVAQVFQTRCANNAFRTQTTFLFKQAQLLKCGTRIANVGKNETAMCLYSNPYYSNAYLSLFYHSGKRKPYQLI